MEHITINNKEFPVKFGLNAMRLYCREHKIELDEITAKMNKINLKKIKLDDIDFMAELILFSIKNGLRKEGNPTNHGLTIDDFYDLMESDEKTLNKLFDVLADGMPDPEEEKPEEPKN